MVVRDHFRELRLLARYLRALVRQERIDRVPRHSTAIRRPHQGANLARGGEGVRSIQSFRSFRACFLGYHHAHLFFHAPTRHGGANAQGRVVLVRDIADGKRRHWINLAIAIVAVKIR